MSDASTDSRVGLVVVDDFTVTFLVDDCIEWWGHRTSIWHEESPFNIYHSG